MFPLVVIHTKLQVILIVVNKRKTASKLFTISLNLLYNQCNIIGYIVLVRCGPFLV